MDFFWKVTHPPIVTIGMVKDTWNVLLENNFAKRVKLHYGEKKLDERNEALIYRGK